MTATATTVPDARARTRVRAISPALAVGGLVLLSLAVRLAVAWARRTPVLLPDEYIYSELGRSLAAHGRPLVRGEAAHFPSLLAPLLTSPAWLVHDVATAYRLVQAIQALAMSLAAVPAWWLARRLGLGAWTAVALAGLALCLPDFLYSPFVTAEAFAYPLVLATVAAGVAALERPRARAQLLFVGLALATTLARIQFVILPAAYVGAAAVLALRDRDLRGTLCAQRLPVGLFALGGLVLAVAGIGYYSEVVHLHPAPLDLVRSAATNALVLGYAVGWAIVPAGLIGLALALARPRDRAELAFGSLAAALAVGVFAEAAAYGSQTHERYTFYLGPLLALAFALYARRGWPHRLALALVSAVVATAATLVPLTDLSQRGEQNTAVLVSMHWLRLHTTTAGAASLLALTVSLAALAGVALLARRPRVATPFALAVAAALGLAAYAAAAQFDHRNSIVVQNAFVPGERSWVDAQRLGPVSLLQASGGKQTDALIQLFWNRSVDRLLTLPGGQPVDAFRTDPTTVGGDGTLRVAGRPLTGPLLVDGAGSTVLLRGARRVASSPNYDLWLPRAGAARLSLYFAGRARDGWLGPVGRINLWSRAAGTLRLPLTVPRGVGATTLHVRAADGSTTSFALRPGTTRVVELPVCGAGEWHVILAADAVGYVGDRPVVARAGVPRLVSRAPVCSTAV